jgi:hypothetical protein
MNIDTLRSNLEADGLPQAVIDSLIATAEREATRADRVKQPKRKGNAYHAGKRVTMTEEDVEVTCMCNCCGNVDVKTLRMEVLPNSPRRQKIATSLCSDCPTRLRTIPADKLVSIILLKCHPAVSLSYLNNTEHIRLAGKYTPEQVVMLNPTC